LNISIGNFDFLKKIYCRKIVKKISEGNFKNKDIFEENFGVQQIRLFYKTLKELKKI